jgi:hypothetical protein
MATSEVQICNSALLKLGADRITSMSDDTKSGRACNEQYAKLRDELLGSHPWNFATARVELAQVSTTIPFGFEYAYQLPSDCLRVLEADTDYAWKIEGRYLLSDDSAMNIKYITQVTDVSKFSPMFCEALSLRIAADLAFHISNSASLTELMMAAYEKKLREARSYDAQEGSVDTFSVTTWIDSRR